MHSLIALLICHVLLLTEGRAKSKEEFQYQQNVPEEAKKALLGAINEERKTLAESLGTITYDEDLAKKAHNHEIGRPLSLLEGSSKFESTWKETLKRALTNSPSKTMANVAERIGCEITLKTSPEDGSHTVTLYCLLSNKNKNFPNMDSDAA